VEVDLDAVADMLSAVVDGRIILAKGRRRQDGAVAPDHTLSLLYPHDVPRRLIALIDGR
jgi:hypothetical protein